VLDWPLVRRRRGLFAELIPLGSEATDYNPLLVAPSPRSPDHIRAGLALLQRMPQAGLVSLPLVRADSAAASVLGAMARSQTGVIAGETLPAPYLDISSPALLAAHEAAMSKNLRRGIERRRRRLEEMGPLSFEVVTNATDFAGLLDWTLAAKAEWLHDRGLKTEFVHSPNYRAFWQDIQTVRGSGGQVDGMALRLDGQIIAAKIVVRTSGRLEGFLTTFERALGKFFRPARSCCRKPSGGARQMGWPTISASATRPASWTGPMSLRR
jgi:CelD/BcsL family acetyltransferase involved in cellulose biosynthesis